MSLEEEKMHRAMRGDSPVGMEAETLVTLSQAKACPGPPEAGGGGRDSPIEAEGARP